jgi:hypothetical protein
MKPLLKSSPVEIQNAGWMVLRKQLGLAGALRFFLQYKKGQGDYTQIRRKLFKGKTVEELIREIKK